MHKTNPKTIQSEMLARLRILYQVLFLLVFVGQSIATKYQFVLENEKIFSDCPNQPSNVHNCEGLFDTSEATFKSHSNAVQVSGNVTAVWNIQPGDRIQTNGAIYRHYLGAWQLTPITLSLSNFCQALFDKDQYWHKYWPKHITNKEEVKEKCLGPGTKLTHEPFDLDMIFDASGLSLTGRHKIVIKFKAFDANNVQRETSICFEILGEFKRL